MNTIFVKVASLVALLSLLIASIAPASALGDVNSFEIQRYSIDYYLAQDSEQRSTLKTIETISAEFPQTDQNHGIERAIPSGYDGHPTSLEIASVSDATGKSINYTTYDDSNGNTVLRIGDADTFVHGLQTFHVTYTQRDVTKYFSNTKVDEFYWDTNGTGWLVPIKALDVRLHVDEKLVPVLSGKQQCYKGRAGSTLSCEILAKNNGLAVKATNLNPGENVTIAVGFKPHTFAVFKPSLAMVLMGLWIISLVFTLPIALILLVWVLARYHWRLHRIADIGTIVPEYLPPREASVSTSARIVRKYGRTFSAQLIDLAVRHYIKIYQTREKSLFKKAHYELEIIKDISDLKAEEREIIKDIFADTAVGMRLDMATLKRNSVVSMKLSDNQKKVDKSINGKYALRARDAKQSAWFKRAAKITFVMAVLTLSPWLLIVALVSLIIAMTMKPLTNRGLALVRYLKGLEMYIKTAEIDRLHMLQSHEGATKLDAPVDADDKRQLVKLYERVLPYAMLFGQEKEWNKQLGKYYETLNESPSWYTGNNMAFNAVVFSTAMNDFSQVASYSDPTSASSGGSGGGGSSGGGGGGGGGGGW